MKKYRKSIQKKLIFLINNYMENSNKDINENNESISIYMKQIFSNIVNKKIECSKLFVIKSEYKFLSNDLCNKLFKIKDDNHDNDDNNNNSNIKLYPFLSKILNNDSKKIKFVTEYIWFLNSEEFKVFKNLKKDEEYRPTNTDDYIYKINDNDDDNNFNDILHKRNEKIIFGYFRKYFIHYMNKLYIIKLCLLYYNDNQLTQDHNIKFIPFLIRSESSLPDHAFFCIQIKSMSAICNSVKLTYSYCIDELKLCINNHCVVLKQGGIIGYGSFPNCKLNSNKLTSLTFRIAMLFDDFK